MNFTKERDFTRPRVMQHGDLVIVYERHDSLDHFFIEANTIFNNKYGTFHHNDMIGKPFGSKINSKSSPGYVYLLEPTPELWTTALHTRTQIVDEVDSSVITLNLDVHPGCTVVETGTGSGCMTMSLARAVHPTGHVFTFEYNGVRAEKARKEFDKLGVGHLVTVTHRDVCSSVVTAPPPSTEGTAGGDTGNNNSDSTGSSSSSSGSSAAPTQQYCTKPGGFPNVPDAGADAVFLDLPEPWLALEHVLRVLKPGRTMCSYSPCIEQVIKTCDKLRELKFHSIRMIEVRQRPYDARVVELETLDLGLTPEGDSLNNRSARDIGNVHQRYKAREDAPVPVFQARSVATAPSSSSTQGEERGCMEEVEQDAETGEAAEGEEQASDGEGKRAGSNARDDAQANKRRKIRFRAPAAEGAATATATATADACSAAAVTAAGAVLEGNVQVFRQDNMTDEQFRSLQNRIKNRPVTSVNGTYEMHISRPIAGMKGHTAFLTFAVAPLMR